MSIFKGLDKGEKVDSLTRIDVISRALNPYANFSAFMELAEQPEIRFVISNTTEAGITFDPACKLEDAPASSYPGKLTQLLYHRYKTFNGDKDKGLIIFPCELIFLNGHKLKEKLSTNILIYGNWEKVSKPGLRNAAVYMRHWSTVLSQDFHVKRSIRSKKNCNTTTIWSCRRKYSIYG